MFFDKTTASRLQRNQTLDIWPSFGILFFLTFIYYARRESSLAVDVLELINVRATGAFRWSQVKVFHRCHLYVFIFNSPGCRCHQSTAAFSTCVWFPSEKKPPTDNSQRSIEASDWTKNINVGLSSGHADLIWRHADPFVQAIYKWMQSSLKLKTENTLSVIPRHKHCASSWATTGFILQLW